MVQSSSISITPATHADRHEHGGVDPLTGDVRIDPIEPASHAASHEGGGSDFLSIGDRDINTSVFAGAAPTSWTDLDLSSVVGTRSAFVMLRVVGTDAAGGGQLAVRTKGDTYDYPVDATRDRGTCVCTQGIGVPGLLFVQTDASGIIQHNSNINRTIAVHVAGWF